MSIDSKKISHLIERQVPEFVRDDYPNFVTFLKAYYEFLENVQGTQKNDLITQSKDFRYISDVDESIDKFETHFFETYLNLFPKNVAVDKAFLIKNVLPFYLAKGSENSFKFLFSLLYGEEIDIKYPRDNILRASDGKWQIDTILRVYEDVYSVYDGDGTTKEFILVGSNVTEDNITVYIDDVIQNSGFLVNNAVRKILFDSAPSNGSKIKILYDDFDISVITNRKITGKTSGAYALIEKTAKSILYGRSFFQLYINEKTLSGTFKNNETIKTDIIDSEGNLISLELNDFSVLDSITVFNGGSGYNVGDPVVIGGLSSVPAKAIVSEIVTGTVDNVAVQYGGAGFKTNHFVSAEGYSNTTFNAVISLVDTSGTQSSNTLNVLYELITPYESVVLSSSDYGFPKSVDAAENTSTVIANALSTMTLSGLGPITQVTTIPPTYLTVQASLNADSPTVNATVKLVDLGIIGRININNGGSGYQVGEYVTFTNQTGVYSGYGANAQITAISPLGAITKIKINDGGTGYSQLKLPALTVNSANGTSANITVGAIMGDGETLVALFGTQAVGKVLKIRITDAGAGYEYVPPVDLTGKGDGLASANAVLNLSTSQLPGRWVTTDSIISSDDRRLEGVDYYINNSYVIKSRVEFSRYKELLKKMIHPAGFINYNEYNVDPIEIVASNIETQYIEYDNSYNPSLNLNFNTETLVGDAANITFTRSTHATMFDANGVLQFARNNMIRNSTMIGAVKGSPGTNPTNWILTGLNGNLTAKEIISTGTENGIYYVDVRYAANGAVSNVEIRFDSNTQITASNTEVWTGSVYTRLRSGSTSNVTFAHRVTFYNSTGLIARGINDISFVPTSNSLSSQRQTNSYTGNHSTVARVINSIRIDFSGAGDFVLRVGMPQLERGNTARSVIATSGTAYQAPRLDYDPSTLTLKGLLVEESRTNFVRNNKMFGAVAGTPGTDPNRWYTQILTTTGLTKSVEGIGTEDGIDYIDFRLQGTASGAGKWQFLFEYTNGIPASVGQTWSTSAYVRLVSGTTTGITNPKIYNSEYSSVPAYLSAQSTNVSLPTSAPLRTQRVFGTSTLTNGSTSYVVGLYELEITNGATIDITVRVGMPQTELGEYATSVIPTSVVAAVTRSGDLPSINVSSIANDTEGTLVAEGIVNSSVTGVNRPIVSLSRNVASAQEHYIYLGRSADARRVAAVLDTTTQASYSPTGTVTSTKGAIAYRLDDTQFAFDGTSSSTDTVCTMPTGLSTIYIGTDDSTAQVLGGWVKNITYYQGRLPNTQLEILTT